MVFFRTLGQNFILISFFFIFATSLNAVDFDSATSPETYPEAVREINLAQEEIVQESFNTKVPLAPKLSSPTHPIAENWYSSKTASFEWEVPSDADAVRVLLDNERISTPNRLYIPPIGNKSVVMQEDGIFYFHLQVRNNFGWSPITHRMVKVDLTKPESVTALLVSDDKTKNPNATFLLAAKDKTSGISHFILKLDNDDSFKMKSNGENTTYTIPNILPGEHTLLVRAVDYAGNFTSEFVDFTVLALDTPLVITYSENITPGAPITVTGITYPSSEVEVLVKDSSGNQYAEFFESDNNGNFNAILEQKFDSGTYKIFVKVVDYEGAQSNYSNGYKVVVRSPSFITLSGLLINWLSLILISMFAVTILAFMTWYLSAKFMAWRRKVKRNIDYTDPLFRDLSVLINTIATHHKTLLRVSKKRDLTKEEKSLLNSFKKRLENIESDIDKKVGK